MHNLVLATNKEWANTLLFDNGALISAEILTLRLKTNGEATQSSGLQDGGSLEAWIQSDGKQQDILPGSLEIKVMDPTNKQEIWNLQIVNPSPSLDFLKTTVLIDSIDCTEDIVYVEVIVDSVADNVSIWYKLKTADNGLVANYQELVIV